MPGWGWQGADPSRPVVVYAHGIQSHPDWFVGSAEFLARKGWPVLQVTRRGSGTSAQPPGDTPSWQSLLADVTEAVAFARKWSGRATAHLLGVSWGGKLLASWLAEGDRTGVAGLTLVAPGICPHVDVSAGTKLAIGAALLCCRRRRFPIPLSQPGLFTDNPARQAFIREDPHKLTHATARFLFASRRLDDRLARADAGCIGVPTSLILSARDRIIDNERTARAVDRLAAVSPRLRTLDGAHTLEFEPDPQPFLTELAEALQWAPSQSDHRSPAKA